MQNDPVNLVNRPFFQISVEQDLYPQLEKEKLSRVASRCTLGKDALVTFLYGQQVNSSNAKFGVREDVPSGRPDGTFLVSLEYASYKNLGNIGGQRRGDGFCIR